MGDRPQIEKYLNVTSQSHLIKICLFSLTEFSASEMESKMAPKAVNLPSDRRSVCFSQYGITG